MGIKAQVGDVFEVTFRRSQEGENDKKEVTWQRQRNEALGKDILAAVEWTCSIAGSWDLSVRPREMLLDRTNPQEPYFRLYIKMSPKKQVDYFQLLPGCSWMACLTPWNFGGNRYRGCLSVEGNYYQLSKAPDADKDIYCTMEIRLLLTPAGRPLLLQASEYEGRTRPPEEYTVSSF